MAGTFDSSRTLPITPVSVPSIVCFFSISFLNVLSLGQSLAKCKIDDALGLLLVS